MCTNVKQVSHPTFTQRYLQHFELNWQTMGVPSRHKTSLAAVQQLIPACRNRNGKAGEEAHTQKASSVSEKDEAKPGLVVYASPV